MRVVIHAAGIARGGGLRHVEGLLPALDRTLAGEDRAWVTLRASVAQALGSIGERVTVVPVAEWQASMRQAGG